MSYERPEALEVSAAGSVILGAKEDPVTDVEFQRDVDFDIEELE